MKLEVVPIGVTDAGRAKDFYYERLSDVGIDIREPKTEAWGAVHSYLSDPDDNRWTFQQKPKR